MKIVLDLTQEQEEALTKQLAQPSKIPEPKLGFYLATYCLNGVYVLRGSISTVPTWTRYHCDGRQNLYGTWEHMSDGLLSLKVIKDDYQSH